VSKEKRERKTSFVVLLTIGEQKNVNQKSKRKETKNETVN